MLKNIKSPQNLVRIYKFSKPSGYKTIKRCNKKSVTFLSTHNKLLEREIKGKK